MIKKFEIFESPDTISFSKFLSDPELHWTDEDARAFGYYKKDFMLHKGTHTSRWRQDYPGRIWLDSKIISFWEYPENKKKLKKIITDIENRIKQNIWNQGWQIEILWNDSSKIIPLEDYENAEAHELDKPPTCIIPITKSG